MAYNKPACDATSEYQYVMSSTGQSANFPGFWKGIMEGSLRKVPKNKPHAQSYEVVRLDGAHSFKTGKDNQMNDSTPITATGCTERPNGEYYAGISV